MPPVLRRVWIKPDQTTHARGQPRRCSPRGERSDCMADVEYISGGRGSIRGSNNESGNGSGERATRTRAARTKAASRPAKPKAAEQLTPAERAAWGRAARALAPRSGHG